MFHQSVNSFLLLFLLLNTAFGEEEYPKPSTGVDGDYYVCKTGGDDSFPGTYVKPFKTPDRAIKALKSLGDASGKKVLIRGGVYRIRDNSKNKLIISNLNGSQRKPLEIRGYPGEEVILDSFSSPFNPVIKSRVPAGFGGVSFKGCSHIILENIKVCGRARCNFEIIDSNHITVRFCEGFQSDTHGLLTDGTFHHLTIEACKFYEQIYGSMAGSGIYISGGQWTPEKPPVQDLVIRHVECFFNKENGIKIIGRSERVLIEHCSLHHNDLSGLVLDGAREVEVSNNLIYKNNTQALVLQTNIDKAFWNVNDSDSMERWKYTHWAIQDVQIKNNTIYMDKDPWYIGKWSVNTPSEYAAVCVEDDSGRLPPFTNIRFLKNIIYTHSGKIFQIKNPEHFAGLKGSGNLLFSVSPPEMMENKELIPLETLQKEHPELWRDNVFGEDPLFVNVTPVMGVSVSTRNIDFSKPAYQTFEDDFHLKEGSPASDLDAGALKERKKPPEKSSIQKGLKESLNTVAPKAGQKIKTAKSKQKSRINLSLLKTQPPLRQYPFKGCL